MTTMIAITDEQGTRMLDMTNVERLIGTMESDWNVGKFNLPAGWFETIKGLNKEQLEHLTAQLMSIASYKARLWYGAFTKEHIELVKALHEIRALAVQQGFDLWPHLWPRLEGKP